MQAWDTTMPLNFHPNWQDFPTIKSEPLESPQRSDSDSFEHKPSIFDGTSMASNWVSPQLGVHPLTPPGSAGSYGAIFLSQNFHNNPHHHQHHNHQRPNTPCSVGPAQSLTPTTTPPMDTTPPKTPKDHQRQDSPDKESPECPEDMFDISDEEDFIRNPKMNSHGKIKKYKCKQCLYVSVTKVDFWDHVRTHMKPEKILQCKKCPFITEYKHHLEYHIRNHDNSKPFRCPQCNYSCVNKSMLNSHLKSHSNVLQYRCADCNYATKYCHSLKLHLRKYTHKPDVVLNLDGTPNPLPIIDVYGTRRGPKTKSKPINDEQHQHQPPPPALNNKPQVQPQEDPRSPSPLMNQDSNHVPMETNQPIISNLFHQGNSSNHPSMPLLPYLNLNLNFQMLAAQRMAAEAALQMEQNHHHENDDGAEDEEEALNLVQKDKPETPRTPKHRRKGRAFKLDRSLDIDEDTSLDESNNVSINTSHSHSINSNYNNNNNNNNSTITITKENNNSPIANQQIPNNNESNTNTKSFECKYCDISFKHEVLFSIHMGYHGYNDVFKCNMCGEKCDDRVSFFLHIARSAHT